MKDLTRNKEFTLTEIGTNYPFKKSIILMQDNDFSLQTEFVDGKFNVRDSFIKKYDVELKYGKVENEKSRKVKVFFEIDNFGMLDVTEV